MEPPDPVRELLRSLLPDRREQRRRAPDNVVLVVEDDRPQQEALARTFGLAGLTVESASNGLEAFEALRQQDYRAIVCDIRMPGQSGPVFYDQLEETFPHLAARVIFVSAYADDPEMRDYLLKTGQPFFRKPYDVTALLETVQQIMRKPFL